MATPEQPEPQPKEEVCSRVQIGPSELKMTHYPQVELLKGQNIQMAALVCWISCGSLQFAGNIGQFLSQVGLGWHVSVI